MRISSQRTEGNLTHREGETGPQRPIQFVNTTGSPIAVGQRDRLERIREALIDLRLVIDGCSCQPPDRLIDTAASLARHCSIFLRKMVLDDDRSPRLLDDEFRQEVGLGFRRIQNVPSNRRDFNLIPVDVARGCIQVTRVSEDTGQPEEAAHVIQFGPQRLRIVVEWPLPGMTGWLNQPTTDIPWVIEPEGLFESQSDQELSCDQWLGQQLVIVDNRGITLKDIIRVTVNTEAAHSPPLERLMVPEEDNDRARFRVVRDKEIHILSHITVCGVRYSHAIVIQAALFLFCELARQSSFGLSEGGIGVPIVHFVPDDVFSSDQTWLRFDGGLAMSLRSIGQSISHRIRAPQ